MRAPRLDNQHQRGHVPRSVVRLRAAHRLTCTTNGGTTDDRRSTIDPLTATAPEAGNASPTSRSRRTWSDGARAPQHPVPVQQPIAVPQDAPGAVVPPPGSARAGPVRGRRSAGCRAGRSRACSAPRRGPAPAGRGRTGWIWGSSLWTIVIREAPQPSESTGFVQAPADVGAVQPGETDVQAVLHTGPEQYLVVGW